MRDTTNSSHYCCLGLGRWGQFGHNNADAQLHSLHSLHSRRELVRWHVACWWLQQRGVCMMNGEMDGAAMMLCLCLCLINQS